MTRPLVLRGAPRPGSSRASLILAAALAAGGCASGGLIEPELPRGVTPDEALAEARADVAAGRAGEALQGVAAIQNERNLGPELRNESDALAERAVAAVTEDSRAPEGRWSADLLEELARLDLPLRQRSRLTVAAGRAHLREDSRILAFKLLRDFEEEHPGHPEGTAASEVVAEAGFSLIADPGRYALLRRYRSRGIGALELLVLRYPSHSRCAEAYVALADAYVENGDLDRAIERIEDLILYHPRDTRTPAAEARLPALRMARVDRDDFDRFELERARDELVAWLERYAGAQGMPPEFLADVRSDLTTCRLRLARNDLVVARFYDRVDVPFGVHQHAERALAQAETAADGATGEAVETAALVAEGARALIAAARQDQDASPRRDRGDEPEAAPPGDLGDLPTDDPR